MVDILDDYIWIVVVGFLIAFVLCLGIGANDVANTFGTSVGAKVLTLRQACVLATIFETAGAVLLGAKVSETIRKGIIDIEPYENSTEQFLLGNLAALSGSGIWLFIATFFKLPVSATHSIVGATVGFALVANGAKGIDWMGLVKIVASWFVSPVLSGLITIGVFLLCDFFILRKDDPLEPGLRWMPLFYGITIVVNVFSIFYDGPEMLEFNKIPLWAVFVMSFGTGIICAIFIRIFLIPWQRRKIIAECRNNYEIEKQIATGELKAEVQLPMIADGEKCNNNVADNTHKGIIPKSYSNTSLNKLTSQPEYSIQGNGNYEKDVSTYKVPTEDSGISSSEITTDCDPEKADKDPSGSEEEIEKYPEVKDRPETGRLFSFLQILTAIFGAFAHGGNDVSNGIGPLISIWVVASTDDVTSSAMTPLWILAYGGLGISIGLWIWGRRVIETMGENLTTVTPSSGFAIEIGAAFTVLVASNIGIPISSTHCKVGSIVFVGRLRSKGNVDWSLFRNIILSWVITLPACMAFSAAIMALLQLTL